MGRTAIIEPRLELLDVLDLHAAAIFVAQHIFQQHFQAVRQTRDIADGAGRRGNAEIVLGLAGSIQATARFKRVLTDGRHGKFSPTGR